MVLKNSKKNSENILRVLWEGKQFSFFAVFL